MWMIIWIVYDLLTESTTRSGGIYSLIQEDSIRGFCSLTTGMKPEVKETGSLLFPPHQS